MELVTGTVDPQIVVVLEPVLVGEQHDADGERAEAELGLPHDLACPANRATAMADAAATVCAPARACYAILVSVQRRGPVHFKH